MKKIVWIAALLLAATSVAYGQEVELPSPSAPPTPGAEVAPVVISEPAVGQPPEAAPPPIHSTPTVRRVVGPVPGVVAGMMEGVPSTGPEVAGFGMTPGTPGPAIGAPSGVVFTLFDPGKGVRYGPFPVRPGVLISVGGVKYVLEVAGLAPPPEEERTAEQRDLENKLRKTMIPALQFEGAPLMEAVNFLAGQNETNIVVTDVLQKTDFSITLTLINIPLYDAIRYVTEVIGVGFRIDDHAVVITHEMPAPRVPPPILPRSGI